MRSASLRERYPHSRHFLKFDEDGAPLPGQPERVRVWVSAFSRWLRDEDFATTPFLFYRNAVEKGLLSDFLKREREFKALFRELSADGVLIDGEKGMQLRVPDDKGLSAIFTAVVRERRAPWAFHFLRYDILMCTGWDLTHRLFLTDLGKVEPVRRMVERNGLHLLTETEHDSAAG